MLHGQDLKSVQGHFMAFKDKCFSYFQICRMITNALCDTLHKTHFHVQKNYHILKQPGVTNKELTIKVPLIVSP